MKLTFAALFILVISFSSVFTKPLWSGVGQALNPSEQQQLLVPNQQNLLDTVEHEQILTQSADGYKLFGIKYFVPGANNLRPALLFPGLMDSVFSPNMVELAATIALKGFAVYLVNPRGSVWGRSGRSAESFSYDEMSRYDLAAWLKLIPEQGNVTFIGHSQGATSMLAALSEGYLKNSGRSFGNVHLLAPVTYLKHQRSVLMQILANLNLVPIIDKIPTLAFEILTTQILNAFKSHTLKYSSVLQFVFGPSQEVSDEGDKDWSFDWPKRTSTRNLAHWLNDFQQGRISKYPIDGDESRPYNLTSVPNNVKLFFYFGYNDFFTDSKDVNLLMSDLEAGGAQVVSTNWITNYAHMDFVWAHSARTKVFPLILNNL